MPTEPTRHWQDVANVALGIWVFISPWIVGGFAYLGSINGWIFGAIVFLASAWALVSPRVSALRWADAFAGAWLIVSPFWLVRNHGEQLSNWVSGALILIFAVWAATRPRRGM